ncbi:MAG: NUDIX domain-containing protein [Gammaproteobacteria bacterium]|nr:NUDIX domain-containing protein [Gammaproteobacteria bacterium]
MPSEEKFHFCPRCGNRLEIRHVDDIARNACPVAACGFIHWDNPVPVVAAIVEHEGTVVLANNAAWPDHLFGLITGFLEKAETPEDAVLREVREELGLEGEIASLVGLYPFAEMNQIIIAYHVRGAGMIQLGAELRAFKRIERGKLRAWSFGTGHAVRDWLAREPGRS